MQVEVLDIIRSHLWTLLLMPATFRNVVADPPRLTDLELEEHIIVAGAAELEEVEDAERIQDGDIEDHCSDSEGEEDDEDNPDEDDLGAEDGEGGFLDAEDDEGYAAL